MGVLLQPKVKLAFQLAAPVLAAAAFTGTIVWNPAFRYFLEGYAPSLGELYDCVCVE
jgi:hypothetical protein